MTRAQRFSSAAAVLATVGLMAVGCSDSSRNPMGTQATAQSGSFGANRDVVTASPSSSEVSGRIATVDPSARTLTLTGNDMVIYVAQGAEIVLKNDGDETPLTLDQINPDDSVDIHGDQSGGKFIADRVRVRVHNEDGEHGPEDEVEFRAVITNIDGVAGTFTVDTRSEAITTDSLTLFFNHVSRGEVISSLSDGQDDSDGKQRIAFADLKVGDTVEVEGRSVDSFTIYAAVVEVENNNEDDDAPGSEIQFKGMISTIDYDTRVITFFDQPDTVTVAPDAQLFGFQGEAVELTFFGVCFIVEIRGTATRPGHVLASSMKPNF